MCENINEMLGMKKSIDKIKEETKRLQFQTSSTYLYRINKLISFLNIYANNSRKLDMHHLKGFYNGFYFTINSYNHTKYNYIQIKDTDKNIYSLNIGTTETPRVFTTSSINELEQNTLIPLIQNEEEMNKLISNLDITFSNFIKTHLENELEVAITEHEQVTKEFSNL